MKWMLTSRDTGAQAQNKSANSCHPTARWHLNPLFGAVDVRPAPVLFDPVGERSKRPNTRERRKPTGMRIPFCQSTRMRLMRVIYMRWRVGRSRVVERRARGRHMMCRGELRTRLVSIPVERRDEEVVSSQVVKTSPRKVLHYRRADAEHICYPRLERHTPGPTDETRCRADRPHA